MRLESPQPMDIRAPHMARELANFALAANFGRESGAIEAALPGLDFGLNHGLDRSQPI